MSDALISRYEKPLLMITKMLIIDAKYYLIISGTPRTKDVNEKSKNQTEISEWLGKKEAGGIEVSQIVLPDELSYDEVPDGTCFSRKLNLAETLYRQTSFLRCRALWRLV